MSICNLMIFEELYMSAIFDIPSESKITPHSAEPLDLSQADETEFDEPPAKVSRPDSTTTSTQITPAKSAYFLKPDTSHNASISQEMLWKFHPNQPVSNIPFNSAVVYDRQGIQGMNINRKWVTYNEENKTLHCLFCLMHPPEKIRNMQMIQGCSDWRHITTRLFEDEKSHCHKHSTDAYFLNACKRFINYNLLKEQLSLRTQ